MESELVVASDEDIPQQIELEIVVAGHVADDNRPRPFGRAVCVERDFPQEILVRVGEVEGLAADFEAVDAEGGGFTGRGRDERIRDDLDDGTRVDVEAVDHSGARVCNKERVSAAGLQGSHAVEENAFGEIGDFRGSGGGTSGGKAGQVELPDGKGTGGCCKCLEGEVAGDDVEDIIAQFCDACAAEIGGESVHESGRVGGRRVRVHLVHLRRVEQGS